MLVITASSSASLNSNQQSVERVAVDREKPEEALFTIANGLGRRYRSFVALRMHTDGRGAHGLHERFVDVELLTTMTRNLALLVLSAFVLTSESFAARYEVDGSIVSVDPSARIRTITNVFRISVDGPRCAIVITNDQPDFDHLECGSDGNDSYFISVFATERSPRLQSSSNKARADFTPGPVPSQMALGCFIWQAYGSGDYYSSATNGLIRPVGYISREASLKGLQLPGRWSTNPDEPHLPNYVEELFKSTLFFRGPKGTVASTNLPEGLVLTNLVFRVDAWTNFHGIAVPKAFSTVRFGLDRTGTMVEKQRVHGSLASIRLNPFIQDLSPQPHKDVLIYEKRLTANGSRSRPIPYFSSNGAYLTTNELAMTPQAIRVLAREQDNKGDAGDLVQSPPLEPGKSPAPDIAALELTGKRFRLSDFRGKYIVLDFWATWCAPCLAAIPHLRQTFETFKTRDNFVLISLSVDQNIELVRGFAKTNILPGVQGFLDREAIDRAAQEYSLRGIPALMLIGPDGKVLALDIEPDKLRNVVDAQLK